MRGMIKAMAERTLLHAGPATLNRWLYRGRNLVLAYHNIVPEGERILGDVPLHLPQRDFARQLDLLLEALVDIVSLSELMDAALHPDRRDLTRRVAITFDDGYRGAIQAGVEELVGRGLPATFFVVPGLVGGQTFWWDALSAFNSNLNTDLRQAALVEACGRGDEVIAWSRRQGLALGSVPEHARSASETELRVAAAQHGIQMASHTWSHPNLARLTEDECRDELTRAADWLLERFGRSPDWLSYPYGRYSSATEDVVRTTDYRGAFRIEGGWLPRPLDRHAVLRLPRLNIPAGLSGEGFALRLSGLLCDRDPST